MAESSDEAAGRADRTRGPSDVADSSRRPGPNDLEQLNEVDETERDRIVEIVDAVIGHGGRVLSPIGRAVTPSWLTHPVAEARWQVSLAVVAAIVLQLILPEPFRSVLVLPILQVLVLIGLLIANPMRIDRRSKLARSFSLLLIASLTVANVIDAGRLVASIVTRSLDLAPPQLLLTGGSIWLTNVIIFALWYWEFDRGGPAARATEPREVVDFLFPQMTAPEFSPENWRSTFPDYLYMSFTNATAFSPTDVMPLSRWAKMLMLLQSLVSLTTVALVVARAVNILG